MYSFVFAANVSQELTIMNCYVQIYDMALLRVQNDLLLAADKGQEAILVLLEYSSAFDTIDHNIMLQRLTNRYSVSGHAIGWFESYLKNRT